MISRDRLTADITRRLKSNASVALLGPRQCGKTTVARILAGRIRSTYFDLELPSDLARLAQPMTALESLRGLVVIDEVHRRPDLFPVLRVLLDRKPLPARFLVLGSASMDLLRQTSESLAGRIALIDMSGFTLDEVGPPNQSRLWQRGGFPRSYLARSEAVSALWRADFVRTFLERDLPQFGVRVPAATMQRFWTMLAHCSGGIWNASEVGRSLGDAHTTVRRHLDALSAALVVRVLEPWFENVGKRLVKAPKVYVRDSGLLHTLMGINTRQELEGHPKLGASWEGFVIEQILARLDSPKAYYWRTQVGAELDLLLFHRGRRVGIEVKFADAPGMSRAMTSALADLELHRLYVVYPGTARYKLAERVEALPLNECVAALT